MFVLVTYDVSTIDKAGARNCALSAITVEELQRGVLTGPAAKKGYEVRKLKELLARFRRIADQTDGRGIERIHRERAVVCRAFFN